MAGGLEAARQPTTSVEQQAGMSLLLDALRRLDATPPAKPTSAERRHARPAADVAALRPSQGAGVEAPAAGPIAERVAVEEARPIDTVVRDTPPAQQSGPAAAVESRSAAPGDDGAAVTTEPSSVAHVPLPSAAEQSLWEAAYYVDRQTAAESPTRDAYAADAEVDRAAVAPNALVEARPEAPAPVPEATTERRRDATPSSIELPRAPRAFDCRSLAAAVRRMRPAGGRLAFVTIGDDPAMTGTPPWSADLADELGALTAMPVERFGAGGLAIEGSATDARSGYRLYFAGAEFATARGALLRGLDAVLLVVLEGSTSIKAAEVVRGALAAQQVEFAGFVYVAR